MKKAKTKISVLLLTLFSLGTLRAQMPQESDLFQTLRVKDSLMFEVGFNQCDLPLMAKLTTEDVEFYHDRDGITNGKIAFISAVRENLCSSGVNSITRVLEENSLEVFPLHNGGELYGALQMGKHSFGSTMARFTHLWVVENGEWKLSRVLSYDHQQREVVIDSTISFIKLSANELDFYLGDYKFSSDFTLSIIQENGRLFGDAQGQKVELKPYGSHKFLDKEETIKLEFIQDDKGDVVGLNMDSPNGEMKGQKVN